MTLPTTQDSNERSARRRRISFWGGVVLTLAIVLSLRGCGGGPEKLEYEVVKVFPHDKGAFTQGILFDGEFLYESTGMKGDSSLVKVNLETGEVLKRRGLNKKYFGEGLALVGNRLIQLTWQERVLFVYDKDTFEPKGEFPLEGDGWGLTTDGKSLIWSDGTSKLRWLNPETFKIEKEIEVTRDGKSLPQLNELEWIEGEIWANRLSYDTISIINPENGKVRAELDLATIIDRSEIKEPRGDVLNGIAYDAKAKRIFVTGKHWPKLFEIRLKPAK